MSLIKPFRGLRPTTSAAEEVVAPPYDVLSSAEAREQAKHRPNSFLHISKPEIDLPVDTDPYDAKVYQRGAENLQRLVNENILIRDPQACYYVYRLTMGSHQQVGLVAVASVEAYDENRIRKHEFTRPVKEDDRVRQIDALNAQTGPVFLTYKHQAEVDALINAVTLDEPEYDLVAEGGVAHTIWVVSDANRVADLTRLFDQMAFLYIADGHHRSAAASRVAHLRRDQNQPSTNEDASFDYFLSVLFPDNQMQILDYNRVVKDLNGLSPESFLAAVAQRFTLTPEVEAVRPRVAGEFGMYLGSQWYRLKINPESVNTDDPVARLDVSVLSNELIAPILGIEDPRRDSRIDFVGGIRGLTELEKRVNSGEMVVAFSLYPTSMAQLMAVADAGEVMPPKSTWFEPKLADGLLSHVLD